jgi:hypothetical protein
MDAYFCYIHRTGRSVAEMRVLTCATPADLDREMLELVGDYPTARFEIFQGERLIKTTGQRASAAPAA